LAITELPLIIQDGARFHPDKGMRLDSAMAFQYLELITEEVKKVGGVMTLLMASPRNTLSGLVGFLLSRPQISSGSKRLVWIGQKTSFRRTAHKSFNTQFGGLFI
jgi:hypothetical protein